MLSRSSPTEFLRRPLRIGLTGGIGSGKSTVANILVGLGAALVDTDAIARELTVAGGGAVQAIARAFGLSALDATGALDRTRMREFAFADIAARKLLQSILHPMISAESERRASVVTGDAVVFDVPLLVESAQWRTRVDRVLVVDATAQTQIERVGKRSGWTPETIVSVMSQQVSRAERRWAADAVLVNDGVSLDELAHHTGALWRHWTNESTR